MRLTLTAVALTLALAAPAPGADEQQWGFIEADGDARLFYGVPDSGSLTIVFICEAERRHIEVVTTVLPRRPRTGQSVRTTLGNGALTARYDGKIGHTESEGFYSTASAAFAPAILDVLKSGTTLTISVQDKRERVPLRGVADSLAKFEAACFH